VAQGPKKDPADGDDFDPGTILNQGVIAHAGPPRGRRRVGPERTLLVTGLARSGTSMLAALLQAAGVWLGDHVYEPINEDAEITQMLRARDFARLDALIRRQNAKTPVWGFKMPDLHQYLQHDELGRFRNPHLIAIFRDPVAVAARNALSEQADGTEAFIETTAAMHSMAQFVRASGLPFLLLSYEKALLFPSVFIGNVLTFCGIAADAAKRAALQRHVQPNRLQYVLTSKRAFEGSLDGVRNGRLHGWARHIGSLAPVLLDLLIDDRLAATFPSGEFRDDLLAAGVGNGNHGFVLDLRAHKAKDSAVIRVRVNRRTFELANSGRSVAALKGVRPG
jgi:hypothetical protein